MQDDSFIAHCTHALCCDLSAGARLSWMHLSHTNSPCIARPSIIYGMVSLLSNQEQSAARFDLWKNALVSVGFDEERTNKYATLLTNANMGHEHLVQLHESVLESLGIADKEDITRILHLATVAATILTSDDEKDRADKRVKHPDWTRKRDDVTGEHYYANEFVPRHVVVAHLETLPSFQDKDSEELFDMVEHAEEREYQAGSAIQEEGHALTHVFIIREGDCAAYRGETLYTALTRGEAFNTEHMLRSTESVIATNTVSLLCVPWASVLAAQLLKDHEIPDGVIDADRYLLYKTYYDAYQHTGLAIVENEALVANFIRVYTEDLPEDEFVASKFSQSLFKAIYKSDRHLPYRSHGLYLFSKFLGEYLHAGDDWDARCACIFNSMCSGDETTLGIEDFVAVGEIQLSVIRASVDTLAARSGMTKEELLANIDQENPREHIEAMFWSQFDSLVHRMSLGEYKAMMTFQNDQSPSDVVYPPSMQEHAEIRREEGRLKVTRRGSQYFVFSEAAKKTSKAKPPPPPPPPPPPEIDGGGEMRSAFAKQSGLPTVHEESEDERSNPEDDDFRISRTNTVMVAQRVMLPGTSQ